MLVDKIILRDKADGLFDDLIMFDKSVNVYDIRQAIKDFAEFNEEYDNEDIYHLIKDYFGDYTIIWVGDSEIVEY